MAYLAKADLTEANLSEADLKGADLSGAKLKGTNLGGAELEGAKGLERKQIVQAARNKMTKNTAKGLRPRAWRSSND